ncbi:uncharacterized protein [Amphiura filiformis]|uniref:uncharacterized protein n=1 Tax=Amphiura filiformis TaxID=82378 RepID=UPI003B219B48
MVEVVVHRCGYLGHTDDAVEIYTSTTGVTASGADFTEIAMANPVDTEVSFAQGDCAVAHRLALTPDDLVEGMEYFEVVIGTISGTNAAKGSVHTILNTAKVFILDHSTLIWIDPIYVGEEDNTVCIYVHRSGFLGDDTTVALTLGAPATATVTDDYAIDGGSTVPVVFADGDLVKKVVINLVEDDDIEDTEYVTVTLGAITVADTAKTTLDADRDTATIFILDRSFMFWIDPVYIGDECDTMVEVVVHRCGYLGHTDDAVEIYTSTTGVTASGADFTEIAMASPVDTEVSFAQGDCAVAHRLALTPDDLVEGMEYFEVVIGTITGTNAAKGSVHTVLNTAKVFILDHSTLIWIDPIYVGEEDNTVCIYVHRSGFLGDDTTVATATVTDDYAIDGGSTVPVVFADGDLVKKVVINLVEDDDIEDTEYVTVTLGAITVADTAKTTLDADRDTATIFILDRSFMFWIDPVYIGDECDTMVEVVVHRCGYLGHTDDAVEIYTSTTGVTASGADFTEIAMASPVDTEVSFAQGDCAVAHRLALTPDDLVEGMEYFEVVIGTISGTNAAKGSVHTVLNTAKVFILDHSTLIWIDPIYVGEEDNTVCIYVHRSGFFGDDTTVALTLGAPATATVTDDYAIDGGSTVPVVFADGELVKKVVINLAEDDDIEDTEYVTVTLGAITVADTAKTTLDADRDTATIFILDRSFMFWIDPVYIGDECDTMVEVIVHRCGYLGHTDDAVEIYTSTTGVTASGADFTEIAMANPVDTEVSFAQGDCVVAHRLALTPDDLVEGMEYFEVVIGTISGANAAKGSVHTVLNTAKVFILDHSTLIWIDPIYVGEEDNTVCIYVHRSGFLGDDTTVALTLGAPATATVTDDYAIDGGSTVPVVFADGDLVKKVVINLVEDDDIEDTEYVTVTLGTITVADTAKTTLDADRDTATIFILDRSFMFWIDPVYIGDECDTMVEVVVHRCGYLGHTDDAVEIYTSTTGVTASGADFTEIAMANPVDTEVSFAQGDCAVAHRLALTPDDLVEGMEYFEVVIGTISGANAAKGSVHTVLNTAKVFILDHSTILWIDSTYTGEEGSMVKLQIHRFGYVGQDTSVAITLTPQTAVIGDYVDIGGATTIDFVDGEIVQELFLDLETDALVEGIEYFQAVLGAVTVADTAKTTVDPMLNTANIFILDLTSYFWIEEKQFIAFEETTLPVTFHRGGYLGRTDVIEVSYTDARATDPEDYAPVGDATITFNDDETTATKMIDIEPDNILEYNEMFFLEIEIPAGSTLLDTARLDSPSVSEVIIKDPTWYVFDCADFTVIESTGEVNIIIVRKGDLRTAGHVWIGTRDRLTPVELTASSDTDFTPIDMQVDFDPGQSVETVTIDITHDTLVEGDEQFQVYLYDPDTAEALGDLHKAIVTIYDDDDSSTYSFRRVVHHVTESSGSVIITLLRDGPLVSDTDGSVDISTVDGVDSRFLTAEDGTDFVGFESETIKFPAGNRIVHHTISLADGVDVDKQEYFEVCMSNPTFGTIDPPECAIVYIEDDDSVFGFDKPVYYVKEDSSVTVNIVRLGCLKVRGSVVISTNDVTALADADYRFITNRPLSFDVQQTHHTLEVLTSSPDFRVEGEERFELCLSNPVQGVLGLYGLIRCTTVVIEDCDTEVIFGDVTYTVNEGVGVVTVKVVRRGYLNNIVSVDVVSSDVNAKAGATKDYIDVLHTVVFGVGDDPQENTVCFDIIVNDDDVVEHLETFHLELQNINNGLIGEPRIAEVFIEDNDVTYSLDSTKICGSEADGEVKFTVTRDGNLNEETSIDIFTRDISTSSSQPNQDYLPLLEELSHNVIFAPGETSKTVTIDIVDDTFYELPEEFEVILASDITAQLSAPSSAVVTIISDDITCAFDCQNGGFCVGPDECQCADGYTGTLCEEDKNECELNPPVCIGNNIECFNKVGTYKCICTDPEYSLEGNRCVRETKTFIGRIDAYELDDLPLQFVREMYDPDSEEFKNLADIVETQFRNILPRAVDGFYDASVARIFPTPDGHVGVVFETSVAAASRTDGTDVDTLIAASITPDGYLGDSTLRIARPIGQGQYTRSIEGIFYASNGEEFDPRLLDTNSPEFLQFASEVNPALAPIFPDLEGLQGLPRVKEVIQLGDMIGVVYEVPVASTSPATVSDVDEVFARTTGLSGYLGNTDLLLLSIGDRCPSSFCANGGVCTVQGDFTFSCICDAGVSGGRCQGINGTGNTANDIGITTNGWIALGYGVGCSALAALLVALCCIYCRMGRVGRTNIPFDIEPPLPSYVVRDPYIEVDDPNQLILDTPLESIYRTTGQLTPAFPSLLNMANSGTVNNAYLDV